MKAIDEAGKHLTNKGDEDAINFRPSSNFKYMKKYCKGKGESSMGTREEEEGGVNPPLPRDPPPPDSPPAPLLTLKLELKEEEEYETACEAAEEDGKDRVMCRQFARGACTRGQACIYAHEIILSQLPGIYTFCRDYQNSTCSFPRCKFVHASVFEKEYFYRTGFLPPRALKHLKENTGPAPVPPAPHHHPLPEGGQAEVQAAFSNLVPASLVHPGAGGTEARPSAEALPPHAITSAAAAPASLKRDYRDMDDLSAASVAAAPVAAAPVASAALAAAAAACEPAVPRDKCSNCDVTAFRRQCMRNKAEKLKRSIQDLDKKTALLEKKNAKQFSLLLALGKYSSTAPGSNHRNDKQKAILDKLNVIFSSNGGHPSTVEENSNKLLSTAVVRLLLTSADEASPAPADAPGPRPATM